ncbi:hypothetical protein ACFL6T_03960 [Candidatus Zixiibacteriota bacterium]
MKYRIERVGRVGMMIAVAAVFMVVTIKTEAQVKPYVAFFTGQTNANWSRGQNSEELDWRSLSAFEVGIQLFGMTISPGIMGISKAEWEVPTETTPNKFELQYRTLYLNIGAREEFGVYFSGGLNWTIWDKVPQPPDGSYVFEVDSEIGFQAFLGFIVSLEVLPVKLLLEVGYAQFSGVGGPLPAGAPADLFQALSTGPMARFGFAIGK